MKESKQIIQDLKKGAIKPIYFLMGEESYFIDEISEYIETQLLQEEDKGFNQMVLYGRDVSINAIVSHAKRYPMMAERQVIVVKEAQDLSRTIEQLVPYAENPQPTTVLVLCYKYKKIDKRKKLYKAVSKSGLLFESKKLYENQVSTWIQNTLEAKKYTITPKGIQMLVSFLGTDLSKINNELEKLAIVVPQGSQITEQHIEDNIGISKDYNIFELRKAIGIRDVVKAHRIINYFAQNSKDNPLVMTISLLFSYFSQLMQYHGLSDKSKGNVASALRINPYFVSDYVTAAQYYPMKKVSQIITLLREADMKSKGVAALSLTQADILKEVLIEIFNP